MQTLLTPATLKNAEAHIAAADRTMAAVLARHAGAKLARRQPPFHVLATSIINQQLSQKAAAAIEKRIAALAPAPFAAAQIAALSDDALRQTGLSRPKIQYVRGLAAAQMEGLLEEKALKKMTDAEVIAHLTALRGVGVWTAEMFLLFGLRRPDVLSLGDAGLLRAARNLYGKRYKGDDAAVLQRAAEKWRPWRSVGCYYLWRSLDAPAAASKKAKKAAKK